MIIDFISHCCTLLIIRWLITGPAVMADYLQPGPVAWTIK